MKQYFTSIEINDNNEYVGTVHEASTNNAIYKTKPYSSQTQATLDVAEYLKTQTATTPNTLPKVEQLRSGSGHTVTPTKRCCGR